MKYFGCWANYSEMIESWGKMVEQPIPTDEEVLFASYGYKDYEGDAVVIFLYKEKLYEVHGGHCSCFGLSENSYNGIDAVSQWSPEKTTWPALRMCKLNVDQHEPEAIEAYETLLKGE